VDFNYMLAKGVVGLSTRGTLAQLAERGITLEGGLFLNVWDADANGAGERDDLVASGHVEDWEGTWVLRLTGPIQSESELGATP
jgi:hypothetical protein